jgi:hypothetical protein
MADSNDPRFRRAYDAAARNGADDAQRGGDDPLAELARLIGQSDPFADFERHRQGEEVPRGTRPAMPIVESRLAGPSEQVYDHGDAPHHAADYDQAQYRDEAGGYVGDAASAEQDPYAGHQAYYDPYDDPDRLALDEAEYQEEEQRKRRRRRLATVAGILALAVFGGAGAYGYRTYIGAATQSSPPPVIKADSGPTKIIPATQAANATSNKLIYDRVGEKGQTEKVVPREEKPVDIKAATAIQPPRNVYSSPDTVVAAPPPTTIPVTRVDSGAQVLPAASSASFASQGSGAILPSAKKVRTVTIRPDMTVVSGPGASNPEPPRAEPPGSRPTAPPPAPRSAAPPPAPRGTPPVVTANPPPAAPAPPRVASPPPRHTASTPLSLSPGDVSPAAPRAVAPPANAQARAPTTGNFMVQVASQRSEADAKASYRTLQSKYPNVLGGRESFVRRADLGTKGVYYRAMVGPFTTGEQAVQFCTSLKAAGGQCIIHRN